MKNINLYINDLPEDISEKYNNSKFLAIDTETLGLNPHRDRLCLVQMCNEDGLIAMVKVNSVNAPNLKMVLENEHNIKLFHYARFDLAIIKKWLGINVKNVYCTKIASKLCRTYTDKHGLKHLVSELLGIEMDKSSQTTDWGKDELSDKQKKYAASDVIYLKQLWDCLEIMLKKREKEKLAMECFNFLPTLIELDLKGWDETIFSHH